MWLDYEMKSTDFRVFGDESPRHMDRIEELADMIGPPYSRAEILEMLENWVKNYEYVFKRRLKKRKQG